MTTGIADFLDLLQLEAIEVNIFRGRSLSGERDRVYGGQVAAQALVAAGHTISDRTLHSFHAYFLRPGDPAAPILYEVDRIHDGRSFAARRVIAIQHGQAIFTLGCSFHKDEEGLEHQSEMPKVPSPRDIESLGDIPPDRALGAPIAYLMANGLDIRFIDGPPWERARKPVDQEQLWFRWKEPLGDDPLLHMVIATFASDLTLVTTIMRRHGLSAWHDDHFGASLDHSMWYHERFRVDEWVLYHQESPVARGARGLTVGSLFKEEGRLVATVAQEGLVRLGKAR